MIGQEMFDKITAGDVYLSYVNDNGNMVICRTNEPLEVVRLIVNQSARVIPFESLLTCYKVYTRCYHDEQDISFSDWVIGETK